MKVRTNRIFGFWLQKITARRDYANELSSANQDIKKGQYFHPQTVLQIVFELKSDNSKKDISKVIAALISIFFKVLKLTW